MTETGKVYRNKSLSLDGKHFENCTFDRCDLDYGGGLPPILAGCSFADCRFSFSGGAAYTLAFLTGMHGGGFAAIVEQTFQGVREGAYLAVPVKTTTDTRSIPAMPPDAHPLASRVPRIVQIAKKRGD